MSNPCGVGIVAGKYESGEDGECIENVKFCDDQPDLLRALACVRVKKLLDYHFCYLEKDGKRVDAADMLKRVEELF